MTGRGSPPRARLQLGRCALYGSAQNPRNRRVLSPFDDIPLSIKAFRAALSAARPNLSSATGVKLGCNAERRQLVALRSGGACEKRFPNRNGVKWITSCWPRPRSLQLRWFENKGEASPPRFPMSLLRVGTPDLLPIRRSDALFSQHPREPHASASQTGQPCAQGAAE